MDTATPTTLTGRPGRSFYPVAFIGIVLIVLLGFGRTYYLKAVFGTPALTALVHLHGIVMSLWLAFFGLQVWLVHTRRVALHRRVGVVATFWAALMLIVGCITAVTAARLGRAPHGVPPLAFLVIPLGDIFVFGVLVAFGISLRNRTAAHKRLMLLSTLGILTPAIARIPVGFIETGGPLVFFGLTDLCIVACVAYDTWKHRRLHPAFAFGALFIIASQPLRLALSGTPVWMHFAHWLVS